MVQNGGFISVPIIPNIFFSEFYVCPVTSEFMKGEFIIFANASLQTLQVFVIKKHYMFEPTELHLTESLQLLLNQNELHSEEKKRIHKLKMLQVFIILICICIIFFISKKKREKEKCNNFLII